MTWFGWVFIVIYVLSMVVSVATKANKRDGSGAVIALIVPMLMVVGILAVGTGTGVGQ